MKSDHALVKISGMLIPLIGIEPDAGMERCDKCRKKFHLWEIVYDGKSYLCEPCRSDIGRAEPTCPSATPKRTTSRVGGVYRKKGKR